jgi:hypothetical protein
VLHSGLLRYENKYNYKAPVYFDYFLKFKNSRLLLLNLFQTLKNPHCISLKTSFAKTRVEVTKVDLTH